MLTEIEMICRPGVAEVREGETVWIEVYCWQHDSAFWCGHHHRRWGPISRCMGRHVSDHVDKQESGTAEEQREQREEQQ